MSVIDTEIHGVETYEGQIQTGIQSPELSLASLSKFRFLGKGRRKRQMSNGGVEDKKRLRVDPIGLSPNFVKRIGT